MDTVDPEEIARFSRVAEEWWDPHGPFKPLHALNPVRIQFILDQASERLATATGHQPLAGLNLIDIGCGGGLVAEPMARLGARVTGIDASEQNIAVARMHAQGGGVDIDYRCTTAEELLAHSKAPSAGFDIVLALEIIEHVAHPQDFVRACLALARPGGMVIFSTLNRTLKAFALAIVGAEYVLRWLPRGTHTFEKFIRPHELAAWVRAGGGELATLKGIKLNPLSIQWEITENLSVNYFLVSHKSA